MSLFSGKKQKEKKVVALSIRFPGGTNSYPYYNELISYVTELPGFTGKCDDLSEIELNFHISSRASMEEVRESLYLIHHFVKKYPAKTGELTVVEFY